MAGFTDAVQGDGLARVQRALARFEADSLRLERKRQRFSHSPPPYTSHPSGSTATQSASANDLSDEQRRCCRTPSVTPSNPSEEQRHRQERRAQLWDEREASKPHKQFSAQIEEERRRIWDADPSTSWRELTLADLYTFQEEARETVKKRWVEQGIWSDKWNRLAYGRWKHEEPLELEPKSETGSDAGSSPPLFSFIPKPLPKSSDKKRRFTERRVVREREREASRPYHQFVYQISKEREESQNRRCAGAADINTRAYENVKNTWIKQGIWNGRWGILPGMSWKHEEPLEEAADDPAPVPANLIKNGSHEAEEAPALRILGSPSPVEFSHRQILLPSKRKASYKDGQPANASLGPIHPSKVSKVAGKRKGLQRRPTISQKLSSDGLPLSSSADTAELQPSLPPSPVPQTLRRSQRKRPLFSGVAKGLAKTASTGPSKRAVRSKPERVAPSNLTTRSSAKLQAVLKRQPSKTTRGKARKK